MYEGGEHKERMEGYISGWKKVHYKSHLKNSIFDLLYYFSQRWDRKSYWSSCSLFPFTFDIDCIKLGRYFELMPQWSCIKIADDSTLGKIDYSPRQK